jgi:hypothetical protein
MLRSFRSVVGAVAVLVGGAAIAQPPAAAPATDLFPLKAKSVWVYKVSDKTVEVKVAGTEKFGTDDCTKLDTYVDGKVQASELVTVKADGVYRVKVKDDKVEPAVKILPLPATKDKEDKGWNVDFKVGSSTVKGTFKVKAEAEKVKTEAGEFDAVVVDGPDLDIAGTKSSVRYWFARGKGIVKLEYVIQGNKAELELKSYTEGK